MLKYFLPAIYLFAGFANLSQAASTVTLAADKTGSNDATSALNDAIGAAGANGTLLIPAGTYKLTGQGGGNSNGCGIHVVTNLPGGISIKPQGAVKFTNSNGQPAYVWSTYNSNVSIDSGATEANPSGTGSFEYAGIAGFCIYAESNPGHLISNETFVGNYVHDLTWGNPLGGVSMGIVDGLRWQFNRFFNIDNRGYQNVTYDTVYGTSNCNGGGECSWDGAAFEFRGGIANADIGWNKISYTGNDGFHVWWDEACSNTYYHVSNNISVHHNITDHIGRIAIEMQAVSSGCAGGCKTYSPGANFNFYSNWDQIHNLPTTNAMSWSINNDYVNQQIYNNSSTIPNTPNIRWFYGIGLESAMSGGIEQGNVIAIDHQTYNASNAGWGGPQTEGTTGFGYAVSVNNNVVCGSGSTNDQSWPSNQNRQNFEWIHQEGQQNIGYPAFTFNGNHRAETCWNEGALQTSKMTAQFTTGNQSFSSGGNGTFKFGVVSALSIDKVAFYVDGSNTPVVTQRLQDLNYDFPSTRQWMYHATFDTGAYSSGTHTLRAVTTDVSGATSVQSQTFTVGTTHGTVPDAPASAWATAKSSDVIAVAWSATNNTTYYNVYRSTVPGAKGSLIATGLHPTGFAAANLWPGSRYYFMVTAVNSMGESAPSAQASAATTQSSSGSSTSTPTTWSSGLISNGDFNASGSPLADWTVYSNGSISGSSDSSSSSYANSSLLAKIATIGSNTQIYQQPISLPAGKVLTLSFYAKANAARTLFLNMIQDQSPYTNYGLNQKAVAIGTSWNMYTVTFNSPSSAVSDARLQFILSSFASGDSFELDRVSLHSN